MTQGNFQTEKMIDGLIFHINQLDEGRIPVPLGFSPNSFKIIFQLLFTGKRNYFVRNNPDLYQKTQKILEDFFKDNLDSEDKLNKRNSFYWTVWIILVLGLPTLAVILFNLSLFSTIFMGMILSLLGFYIVIARISTTHRNILGKKYDEDIKLAVQLLIDHGIVLIRENGLDPVDFPIRLRHDDYNGLVYEKKGKNKFVGVFKK